MTIQELAALARLEVFKYNGHVPLLIAEGTRCTIPCAFAEFPATADARRKTLRDAGADLARSGTIGELVRVFFICEGWMSMPENGKMPTVPPSQDPKRIEVLIVSAADVTKNAPEVVVFELIRDQKEVLTDVRELPKLQEALVEAALLTAYIFGFVSERRKVA